MKRMSKKSKMVLIIAIIIPIIIIVAAFTAFFAIYASAKLDTDRIISRKSDVILRGSNGEVIENNSVYRYLTYDEIPSNLINAFVALEDKRFFKHNGVDYYRTAGALVNNIKAGYSKEGGSTITQQLAKNTQLSSEKTLIRKIKEMNLARQIENDYSKEEILEMYLNAVYFGSGIYGIDSACKNYFGTNASDLSLPEAAMLAGLVKSPSNYSPYNNYERANERKNLVLRLMREQNLITESDYETAKNIAPKVNKYDDIELCAPYYLNAVNEAANILGISVKDILQNGYEIKTFYDESKQKILYNAHVSKEYEDINGFGNAGAYSAILADNQTAGIAAYFSNQKTSVFELRRQPASAIKPILVYAPAFEKGLISSLTPVLDEKIEINGYSPRNYGDNYLGWCSVEDALKYSSNSVAVRLLNETGIENAKRTAMKMGIKFNEKDNNLAIALGGMTDGVTLVELSGAYMTLANGGEFKQNSFVSEIKDKNGRTVYKNKADAVQAISAESAFQVTKMLETTAKSGTARKLSNVSYPVCAKTGTTMFNEHGNLDAWSAGFSKDYTLCVWYGDIDYSDEHAVKSTGGGLPTMLASHVFRSLRVPENPDFNMPEGIVELEIDTYGLEKDKQIYIANEFSPKKYLNKAYFSVNNCPTEFSPYFSHDILNGEIKVEYLDGNMRVEFEGNEEFTYKVNIKDANYGETFIHEMTKYEGNYLYASEMPRFNIYLIALEIWFEGEKLATTPPRILIT